MRDRYGVTSDLPTFTSEGLSKLLGDLVLNVAPLGRKDDSDGDDEVGLENEPGESSATGASYDSIALEPIAGRLPNFEEDHLLRVNV